MEDNLSRKRSAKP